MAHALEVSNTYCTSTLLAVSGNNLDQAAFDNSLCILCGATDTDTISSFAVSTKGKTWGPWIV